MRRPLVRWFVAILGALVMIAGIAVVGAAIWLRGTVDAQDSITTSAQVIPAEQCQTVLIEVADAALTAEEWERFDFVAQRAQETLVIGAPESSSIFLVGVADTAVIEDRLLGAQYCLAQFGSEGWATQRIAIDNDAPDVRFDGVDGLWARGQDDTSVVVPLPESGSTLVISLDGQGSLGDVQLVGRYRVEGLRNFADIALIGGSVTIGIGLVLTIASIAMGRTRGRHEADLTTAQSST